MESNFGGFDLTSGFNLIVFIDHMLSRLESVGR